MSLENIRYSRQEPTLIISIEIGKWREKHSYLNQWVVNNLHFLNHKLLWGLTIKPERNIL